MKLKIAILLMQLALLAGCSGGGESDSGAGNDPAPDNPPVAEDPVAEAPLSLTCTSTPASGSVFQGGQVSAKFKFNKQFNGSGTILAAQVGTIVMPENISINGDELVVSRKTTGNAGEKYSIRLNVNGSDLTAVCTWSILFKAIIAEQI